MLLLAITGVETIEVDGFAELAKYALNMRNDIIIFVSKVLFSFVNISIEDLIDVKRKFSGRLSMDENT